MIKCVTTATMKRKTNHQCNSACLLGCTPIIIPFCSVEEENSQKQHIEIW